MAHKHDLTLCRSDQGDGGWSLHPPGFSDEDIASGFAPILATGGAKWRNDMADWDRPDTQDYRFAEEEWRKHWTRT